MTCQVACLLRVVLVSCAAVRSLSKLRSDPNQLILSVGDTITPAVLKNAFWSHSRHRLKCSLTAAPKPGAANTQLTQQTPRLGRRGRRESLIRKSLRRLRSLERTITNSSDSEEASASGARDESCDEEVIDERCTRESLQLAEAIASYTTTPTAGTPQSALRRRLQARAALSPSDTAHVTDVELGQFLVLQHVAQSCLNDSWIANELFLQLVKHTTEHPGTSYEYTCTSCGTKSSPLRAADSARSRCTRHTLVVRTRTARCRGRQRGQCARVAPAGALLRRVSAAHAVGARVSRLPPAPHVPQQTLPRRGAIRAARAQGVH